MTGRAVTGQFGSWGHRTMAEVDRDIAGARKLLARGATIWEAAQAARVPAGHFIAAIMPEREDAA